MKKTINMFCATILCASGACVIGEEKEPLRQEVVFQEKKGFGFEAIEALRGEYRSGQYDAFLKEMDLAYNDVLESQNLEAFWQLRDAAPLSSDLLLQFHELQHARNERLMQVIHNQDSMFAAKVKSAFTEVSFDPDHRFLQFHYMTPDSGQSLDEDLCIDLDIEYDYKTTHLASMNLEDARPLYYALKMEQMDKLQFMAQSFTDEDLKNTVLEMAKNLDQKLAQTWDLQDIYTAMREGQVTDGSLESKVFGILQSHQSQLADLEKSQ